jgi:endonuclease/exonuclease/phosphatase family metal-dependent hydrolase
VSRARRLGLGVLGLCTGCLDVDIATEAQWIAVDQIGGVLAASSGERPVPFRVPVSAAGTLRVATYNVEMGGGADGLAAAIEGDPALAAADVFLLQEEEAYPSEPAPRVAHLAGALGAGWYYVPARVKGEGTHGLGIVSRYPIEDVEVMALPLASVGHPRIAVSAVIVVDGLRVRIVNVHLDATLNIRDRILQLRPVVLDLPTPILVGGDFNTSPYLWEDGQVPVVPPAQVVSTDQAPQLDDYMRGLGFDTPAADVGPTEEKFGVSCRLDAFFTRGLSVTPATVERDVAGSDHWPLWFDVTLPAP